MGSAGGNVSVTGYGANGTDLNSGVIVGPEATVTSGGSGSVTIQGTSGNANGTENYGIDLIGNVSSGGSGAVTLTGISLGFGGGNSTVNNTGIDIAGTLSSGGGAITANGTAGSSSAGSNAFGVLVGGAVTTTGSVTLNGTGGATTDGTGNGVRIARDGSVAANGTVAITGISGNDSYEDLLSGGASVTSYNSTVTLTGDSMYFNTIAPTGTAVVSQPGGGSFALGSYYYVITAITSNGESPRSNEAVYTAVNATDSANITWNAVAGALDYNIYRTNSSGNYTNGFLNEVAGNVTNFVDTGSSTNLSENAPGLPSITASGNIVTLQTTRTAHADSTLSARRSR